jgi:prevent-host-death family protein
MVVIFPSSAERYLSTSVVDDCDRRPPISACRWLRTRTRRRSRSGVGTSLPDVVTCGYAGNVKVNVRTAKARLSELLERAAAGEDVTITSAGKPKAKLVAAGPTAQPFRVNRRLLAIRPRGRGRPAEAIVREDRDAHD